MRRSSFPVDGSVNRRGSTDGIDVDTLRQVSPCRPLERITVDRRSWLPEDLRAYHRGLLMRLLADDGPMTRRHLAQRSGLSIPTTASIVSELLAGGYVTESMPADRTTGRGPRASLISIVRHGHAVVGVDVSGTRVRLGLCDLSGVVSEVVTVPVDRQAGPDEVLETAVAAAAPLVRSAGKRMLGFGV